LFCKRYPISPDSTSWYSEQVILQISKFIVVKNQNVGSELITRERERELLGREAVKKLIRRKAMEDTTTEEEAAGIIGFGKDY
jgi:hypothetical protein